MLCSFELFLSCCKSYFNNAVVKHHKYGHILQHLLERQVCWILNRMNDIRLGNRGVGVGEKHIESLGFISVCTSLIMFF